MLKGDVMKFFLFLFSCSTFVLLSSCTLTVHEKCLTKVEVLNSSNFYLSKSKCAIKSIKKDHKKIVTFVGYSGAGYELPDKMLEIASNELATLDPRKFIVNIGATPEGIGKIYKLAKEMNFKTIGVVSSKVRPYIDSIKNVDQVYLIKDTSWGGVMCDGKLSPTSSTIVNISDIVIGIGGGKIAYDELSYAKKIGVKVKFFRAEMNHNKAIAKANNRNINKPINFFGEADNFMKK